ncbi:MAG: hypothetical protein WC466_02805 [Candidatus Izemoplasmatales bacterium]
MFTSLLPVAIDAATVYFEVDLPVPTDELYAIDWQAEVVQLGEVAGLVFDFVNAAGLLDGEPDLETLELNAEDVREIFTGLGGSQLVTMVASIAVMEPVLAQLSEDASAIITVPADLDWEEEFTSIGEIIAQIIETGISLGDFESGDPMTIISALATLNFTVLLDSVIVKNALINVLSGAGGFLDGEELSFLVIPDDIDWDTELLAILEAVNAVSTIATQVDFSNFTINSLSELDLDSIDAIFESRILVASITQLVKEQDFGDLPLILPDSIYDEDGYIKKSELIHLVDAFQIIVTELACDIGDTECEEVGFDITKALTLSSESVDTVLTSDIIWATLGNMILDMGAEFLIVPDTLTVLTEIMVESIPRNVVSRLEIDKVFQAVSALGITNLEEIDSFDPSMVTEIAADDDKIATLLASEIIQATVGDLLYDMGGDVLSIPEGALTTVSVGDDETVTIVTKTEIERLLKAVATLEITDIEAMEIDPSILTNLGTEIDPTVLDQDKADTLFLSLIIHATLSKLLIDFDADGALSIPYFSETGSEIRYFDDDDEFEYISDDELSALIQAVLILDIVDFENISIETLDLDMIIANSGILLDSSILQATISDQVRELDAEMIVIPTHDLLGHPIEISQGEGEQAVTYISKAELELTLDAINVLNIDLENPQFDATIIQNLEDADTPGELDDDKLDTLFDSTIIQASLSKMILDFTESDGETEAILIVPYTAESEAVVRFTDHGSNFISKTELVNLFKAIYSLDIDDFNSVDSLSLDTIKDNFDTLIVSATLHATISDQVMTMESDAIVVPEKDLAGESIIVIRGDVGFQTTYIISDELERTFDALEVLNIDFNNPVFDASIVDNLAYEPESELTGLDEDKLNTLFSSIILHASVSKMLIDLTEADEETEAVLVLPYVDVNGSDIRVQPYDAEFVVQAELEQILKALYAMDINDFNSVDSLSLDTIKEHFDTLILSATLHATISDQVMSMESDAIVVPSWDLAVVPEPILIERGAGATLITYISESELRATFNALEVLNIDFNNPVFDASIINNLEDTLNPGQLDNGKLDTLFDSTILHASISKMLIDLTEEDEETEALLVVPTLDYQGQPLQFTDHETLFVSETELRGSFEALFALGITDFNTIDSLTLTTINQEFDTIIQSAIIHATISDQMLTIESEDVDIPTFDYSGSSIRVERAETTYILDSELEHTFTALELLGVNELNNVNIAINLPDFYTADNRNTLLASATIHSAISKQLIELDDTVLEVPYFDSDNQPILIEQGDSELFTETTYVADTEIHALFEVMEILGINDLDTINLDLDLTLFYDDTPLGESLLGPRSTLLASASVHLEISKQLKNLGAEVLEIPFYSEANEPIRVTRGDIGEETDSEYVVDQEIHALFEMLEALNISDLDNVNIDLDLSQFYTPEDRQVLFDSAAVHLEISKQLIGLGTEVLEIPYYGEVGDVIRLSRGTLAEGTLSEYVTEDEVHALFEMLEALNINDLDNVNIDLDLSQFYTPEDRQVLFDSAAVHLEISKQLIGLGEAVLEIPTYDDGGGLIRFTQGDPLENTDSEYVVNTEIHALFEVLEALHITTLDSVNIDLDLSEFYTPEERQVLLDSASVHLEISKQLIGLGEAVLEIPTYDDGGGLIRFTQGDPLVNTDSEYVVNTEIHALFEVLEALHITTLDSVNIDLNLTQFYTPEERQVLLDSASVHLEISKQLFGLGEAVLEIPTYDENGSLIRFTQGDPLENTDAEYVVNGEIHALFEVLEILGIEDLDSVNINLDLTMFYDDIPLGENPIGPRSTLLSSASIHLEISKQLLGLGSGLLAVPIEDIDQNDIRIIRGDPLLLTDSEYVFNGEIHALFEVMEVLGVESINEFPDEFDISIMYDETKRATLIDSASVHLTLSQQLMDLDDVQQSIIVPNKDGHSTPLRIENDYATDPSDWFITKSEIHYFFEGLELLDLPIADVSSFSGAFDMTKLYDVTIRDALLLSGMLHATISDQLLDLDDVQSAIQVPSSDVDDLLQIRLENDILEDFVHIDEIHAFFEAIEVLGVSGDISAFNGSITLSNLFQSTHPETYQQNQITLLSSAIMHATISDQILALNGDELIVPDSDAEGLSIQALVSGTAYVTKSEIQHLVDALDLLNANDIQSFTGEISLTPLYLSTNQDLLLLSATMHATISDQILALDQTDTLIVPELYYGNVEIRDISTGTEFVLKTEIKALIEALEILEITTVGGFNGTIMLTKFFASGDPDYQTNQTTLLTSASMHATISDQLLGLGSSALIIPYTDSEEAAVRDTYDLINYVMIDEIKYIIDALDVLGLTQFDDMDGSFSLTRISTDSTQTTLLSSASMHATISQKINDVDDSIMKVPAKRDDNTTVLHLLAGPIGFEHDFVVEAEIKALINALIIMGYTNLSNFNSEFELDQIFANPATVLLSATIQAMFSDRLLNDTGTSLVIPNEYYGTFDDIRIALSDVTYIEYNELVNLILALDDLGLSDLTNFSFTPGNILNLDDFTTILASEIMQATISKNLLASPTMDETAPAGSGKLIIPIFFRQTINVGITSAKQIEVDELEKLLKAMKLLGILTFGDAMDASTITSIFTDVDKRTVFLASGSMHVTTDNMIKGNIHISGSIPALAKQLKYNIADITTKDEIRDFILAANAMASGSFTDVDFSFMGIMGLTPDQQDTILTSMIVRNKITPDVKAASLVPKSPPPSYLPPFTPPLDDTDYEDNNPANFLRKASIQEVIEYYSS